MKRLALLLLTVGVLSGCYNDNIEELYPQETCDTTNVTYSGTIKPILEQSCNLPDCHNGPMPSGYDFTKYSGLKKTVDNGKLLESITRTGSASFMPKDRPKLDDCTIAKFRIWIDAGAPEN